MLAIGGRIIGHHFDNPTLCEDRHPIAVHMCDDRGELAD